MPSPLLLLAALCLLPTGRDVWEEPNWMGHSDGELARELGAPSASGLIELDRESALDWVGHRSELWRYAPEAAGKTLTVKEMLWEDRFSTRVAWLRRDARGEWRSFATLGWCAGVVF